MGAAVWASGSQLCSGHIGDLTAKSDADREHREQLNGVAERFGPLSVASATMSNVPAFTPMRSRPSSITTEPSSV